MRHGRKEGIKIALSPVITDLPIILLSVLVIQEIAQFNNILGVISLAGGAFLLYLGYETFIAVQPDIHPKQDSRDSLKKGMIANLFNPHPWLFWITIGAPYLYKANDAGSFALAGFLAGFYFFLLGSKITVAFLVDRSRAFLSEQTYKWIMRMLGIALWVFSLVLVVEGIQYLRI